MVDRSLSLERVVITSQIGGRSAAVVMLYSLSMLFSISPYLSAALTAHFAAGGGAAASGGQGVYYNGVGICAGVEGGVILSWRSILTWSVESARSALERASTAFAFVEVWARS